MSLTAPQFRDALRSVRPPAPRFSLRAGLAGGAGDVSGRFDWHSHEGPAGHLAYKLFMPPGLPRRPPLLLMLHGCGQDPDDFALGTGMNALAAACGMVVAYPAQSRSANANGCWNWFRPKHQRRDEGEPGLVASLAEELTDRAGCDDRRVYVAGLSAGGALAAALASLYPDRFAAAGIHSGVPAGAAANLPGALRAMRQGGAGRGPIEVPLIVLHGEEDRTVSPANGRAVASQAAAAGRAVTRKTAFTGPGGRSCVRTLHRDRHPLGRVLCEHWSLEGVGHAWSGGDPRGSHADPAGLDASREMLRFFLERKRRG